MHDEIHSDILRWCYKMYSQNHKMPRFHDASFICIHHRPPWHTHQKISWLLRNMFWHLTVVLKIAFTKWIHKMCPALTSCDVSDFFFWWRFCCTMTECRTQCMVQCMLTSYCEMTVNNSSKLWIILWYNLFRHDMWYNIFWHPIVEWQYEQ